MKILKTQTGERTSRKNRFSPCASQRVWEECTMKLKPLCDRVVLKMTDDEETTKSGIILASAIKEKPQVAVVVAVGPGGLVDGKEVKMLVKEGDKVITSQYSGSTVKLDGEEYLVVRQSDILAIVE